jgi:hypothetical protein
MVSIEVRITPQCGHEQFTYDCLWCAESKVVQRTIVQFIEDKKGPFKSHSQIEMKITDYSGYEGNDETI